MYRRFRWYAQITCNPTQSHTLGQAVSTFGPRRVMATIFAKMPFFTDLPLGPAASGALGRLDVGAGSSVEARGAVKGLLAAVTAGTGTWDLGKGPRGSRAAAAAGAGRSIGRGAGAGVAVGSRGTEGILKSSIVDHRA